MSVDNGVVVDGSEGQARRERGKVGGMLGMAVDVTESRAGGFVLPEHY
jgi:hypothetical protein